MSRIRSGWVGSVAVLALLLGGTGAGECGVITSLFNTGVDASGTPRPDGTIGDPHYSLVGVPSGSTDILVLRASGGFPIGPWAGDDSLSAWIGPNNGSRTGSSPSGLFDYRTTFDLTGLIPSTASISGQWATDNKSVDILINGASSGNSNSIDDLQFHPFSTINSGFIAGTNTLDFIVNNEGFWTGLRVEMTGTADAAAATPEPSSLIMLSSFLSMVGAIWYRKRLTRSTAIA